MSPRPKKPKRLPLLQGKMTDVELSQMRTKRLTDLFLEGSPAAHQLALDFYATLQKNGAADSYQHNIMLRYTCATSDEMLDSIRAAQSWRDRHDKSGSTDDDDCVGPISEAERVESNLHFSRKGQHTPVSDTRAYTTLVRQLVLEGNDKAAQNLVYGGMHKAGVLMSEKARQSLRVSIRNLTKLRQAKVSQFVKRGQPEKVPAEDTLPI